MRPDRKAGAIQLDLDKAKAERRNLVPPGDVGFFEFSAMVSNPQMGPPFSMLSNPRFTAEAVEFGGFGIVVC